MDLKQKTRVIESKDAGFRERQHISCTGIVFQSLVIFVQMAVIPRNAQGHGWLRPAIGVVELSQCIIQVRCALRHLLLKKKGL